MGRAYVAGTFDTKGAELRYIAGLLRSAGVETLTVDLATLPGGDADVPAAEVAAHHPEGVSAVLGGDDRGRAVTAMAAAFERFIRSRDDVGGIIGAGGSGNTALVTPAMRAWGMATPSPTPVDPRRSRSNTASCTCRASSCSADAIIADISASTCFLPCQRARGAIACGRMRAPSLGVIMFRGTGPAIRKLRPKQQDCDA